MPAALTARTLKAVTAGLDLALERRATGLERGLVELALEARAGLIGDKGEAHPGARALAGGLLLQGRIRSRAAFAPPPSPEPSPARHRRSSRGCCPAVGGGDRVGAGTDPAWGVGDLAARFPGADVGESAGAAAGEGAGTVARELDGSPRRAWGGGDVGHRRRAGGGAKAYRGGAKRTVVLVPSLAMLAVWISSLVPLERRQTATASPAASMAIWDSEAVCPAAERSTGAEKAPPSGRAALDVEVGPVGMLPNGGARRRRRWRFGGCGSSVPPRRGRLAPRRRRRPGARRSG